jgi:hypothetical protein
MRIKSKLAVIATSAALGVTALGVASPAFAEFLETGTAQNDAAGSLSYYAHTLNDPASKVVVHRRGLRAFARITADPPALNSFAPSATGGGSIGYNENLRDQ